MTISILALVASTVALGVTLWDKFLRRPMLGVQIDWLVDGSGQRVLRLVLFNMGSRKDCVRELRFRVDGSDVPWTPGMLDRLPLVLDVDEASQPPFLLHAIEVNPAEANPFQTALRSGQGIRSLEVENIRGHVSRFDVPASQH